MMPLKSSFSESIWSRIEAKSEKEFWIDPERRFTYADLANRILAHCEIFRRHDLQPGARVVLSLEEPWDAFAARIAAVLDGLAPANLAADITADRLVGIAKTAEPAMALVSSCENRSLPSDIPGLLVIDTAQAEFRSVNQPRLVSPADETAYLLFTSGTTSAPKGAILTHDNLSAQLDSVMRVWEVDETSRVFNGLVLHHVDGLVQGPVLAAWAGASLLRPKPFLIGKLESDLRWLLKEAATHFISVPTIYDLIDRLTEGDDCFAHSTFRSMLSTSASLRPDLWKRIEKRFGKPVVNEYGMTETVAATHFAGPHHEMGARFTIGKPIDCEAELRDAQGNAISGDDSGELWVRGRNIFAGYLVRPDLTDAVMVDGWFRTGDLCTRLPTDDYKIVGRSNTSINSGGFLIMPEEINEVLLSMPNILDAQTVGVEDDQFGAIPVSAVVSDRSVSSDDVLAFCFDKLEHRKVPKFVAQLEAIPRVASGKADLRVLRDRLNEAVKMSAGPSAQEEAVLDVAARVFFEYRNNLTHQSSPDSVPGWDSYSHLVLVLEVQKIFDVEISTKQIMQIKTLGDLARLVSPKKNQANPSEKRRKRAPLPGAIEPLYEALPDAAANLITLPDIYGNAQYIRHLMQHLSKDLSVYCFKPPDANLAANGLTAVGQYYADVLQQVGFQQPVILLGHSFAGLLAYETACAARHKCSSLPDDSSRYRNTAFATTGRASKTRLERSDRSVSRG